MANKSYTVFMVTQEVNPELYYNPTMQEALSIGTAEAIANATYNILTDSSIIDDNGSSLEAKVYTIIHDRDTHEVWDPVNGEFVSELKHIHSHTVIKLSKPKTINTIANALGLQPEYVEKPKSAGRYAFTNMLAYLIHATYPTKYQYEPENVYSVGDSADYKEIYFNNKKEWDRVALSNSDTQRKMSLNECLELIYEEKITLQNILLTDELFDIYRNSTNKKEIDNAFSTVVMRKTAKISKMIDAGELIQQVVFITGRAGSGKSTFAKELIDKYIENEKSLGRPCNVCKVASSNPVDDYMGEEILLMDDLRGASLGASDWLKLLDPHNCSPSSARYRNKSIVSKLIVITSEKDPFEFFFWTKGTGQGDAKGEVLDQFMRRILAKVRVINFGDKTNYYLSWSGPCKKTETIELKNGKEVINTEYNFVDENLQTSENAINIILQAIEDEISPGKAYNGRTKEILDSCNSRHNNG